MLYTSDFNEVISIIMMLILYLSIYLFIIPQVKPNEKINILILGSIILRVILTITDTYFLYLPNSGGDSVTFELHAYQLLQKNISLKLCTFDNYSKVIYLIYSIIGRKPIVIRAINGIFSMLTGLIVYKSIYLTTEDLRKASKGLLVFLFFPHSLIFSSVILRESFIVFFSTLSIYYFIKYVKYNKLTDIIWSYIFIIMGSLLHAGIIFISIPYIYYILKYKTKALRDKIKKVIVCLAIISIVIVTFSSPDIFLKKLSSLTSPTALFNKINVYNAMQAGSGYLTSFKVSSFKDLIIYAPLKVFYFLFSPMPWDIRGIQDTIAVSLDSVFYLILVFKMFMLFRRTKEKNKKNSLLKTLFFSFILVIGVFAMGTMSSGTAIRHRYKSLTLMIIILASLEKYEESSIKRSRVNY